MAANQRAVNAALFGSGAVTGVLVTVAVTLLFFGGSGTDPTPQQAAAPAGASAGVSASALAPGASARPTVKPDASNTGVPKGTALQVVNGDLVVKKSGTVVDGMDVHGFIVIRADKVTVKRSIVRGRPTEENGALIDANESEGTLIEDVEVDNKFANPYVDGVWGDTITIRRANIHGTVDGMKIGSDSRVESSFIHDLSYLAHDPNQDGGDTHNDAIQILDGRHILITGNSLDPGKAGNAAIQVTQDDGAVRDLRIEYNWADGGGCTFNFAHKVGARLTVDAKSNLFGHHTEYKDCAVLLSSKTTLVGDGNVWADSGQAVPVQQHD
jgi:hypothetical protein